jgi:hypothetical protein
MAVIPTKNAPALIGYYLGIFSLVPCIGLILSIPAIICGILGIAKANAEPEAEGMGHAIAALVLGLISLLLYGGLIILGIIGSAVT